MNIVSEGGQGVTVVRVFPDTPAEQMGIQEGDRITQVNGQQVRSTQEFISQIRNMNPGDQVQLEVDRDRRKSSSAASSNRARKRWRGNQQGGSQSWQQGDETWQTGYDEQRDSYQQSQQGRIARGGDSDSRIQQIEQQVSRSASSSTNWARSAATCGRFARNRAAGTAAAANARPDTTSTKAVPRRNASAYVNPASRSNGTAKAASAQAGSLTSAVRAPAASSTAAARGSSTAAKARSSPTVSEPASSDWNEGGYRSNEGGSDSPGGVTGGLRTRPDNDPNWERR